MKRYDALIAPDPEEWQALDEEEQLDLVEVYHRRTRAPVPKSGARVHALFHVAVENQVALGDETPVKRTLQRLMAEGLDRHDAVHAVGSVLAGHMNDRLRGSESDPTEDPNTAYYAELEALTAAEWRRSG